MIQVLYQTFYFFPKHNRFIPQIFNNLEIKNAPKKELRWQKSSCHNLSFSFVSSSIEFVQFLLAITEFLLKLVKNFQNIKFSMSNKVTELKVFLNQVLYHGCNLIIVCHQHIYKFFFMIFT